jgi:hypothetical protein
MQASYLTEKVLENLPGGIVKQNVLDPVNGDCFSASVSMVTGIPLDILPVLPPVTLDLSRIKGCIDPESYNPNDDHDLSNILRIFYSGRTFEWLKEGGVWHQVDALMPWKELLKDNGYTLEVVPRHSPPKVGITLLDGILTGHATAYVDGLTVDPTTGRIDWLNDYLSWKWRLRAFYVITEKDNG